VSAPCTIEVRPRGEGENDEVGAPVASAFKERRGVQCQNKGEKRWTGRFYIRGIKEGTQGERRLCLLKGGEKWGRTVLP